MYIKHGYKLTHIPLDEVIEIIATQESIIIELIHRQEIIETTNPTKTLNQIEKVINSDLPVVVA